MIMIGHIASVGVRSSSCTVVHDCCHHGEDTECCFVGEDSLLFKWVFDFVCDGEHRCT